MKTIGWVLVMVAGWTLSSHAREEDAFSKGLRCYQAGDYRAARLFLWQAVRECPRPELARAYLKRVREAESKGSRHSVLKRRMEQVTIRAIQLEEVGLTAALAQVREQVKLATGGLLEPNVVIKDRLGEQEPTVTLDLAVVPASEVLRYLAELCGYGVRYESHAIVFERRPDAPLPSVSPVAATAHRGISTQW